MTVHEVRRGEKPEIDDAFARTLGFTDLDAMRKAVRDQFRADYDSAARARMKKQLFDQLEEKSRFPVPPGMFDQEFKGIWQGVEEARKEGDASLAGKSEEELRDEYTRIAERRVKLGLLLSEVARRNKIQVNQDELSRAVMQQAGQFPGQERRVFEFYQKHPERVEQLRGPILEEKAVDFILGKAKITERTVSRAELMNEEENEPAETTAKKTKKKK